MFWRIMITAIPGRPKTPDITDVSGFNGNEIPKDSLFTTSIAKSPKRQLKRKPKNHLTGLIKILQIIYSRKSDKMHIIIGVFINILLVHMYINLYFRQRNNMTMI